VRLARILLGEDAVDAQGDASALPVRELMAAARAARIRASFAEELSAGASWEDSLLGALRSTEGANAGPVGRSLVERVGELPGGERARLLALLYIGGNRHRWDLAYDALCQLAPEDVAHRLPVEAIDTCLRIADEDALARARSIAACADIMSTSALVKVAGRFIAVPDLETCATLVTEARRRDRDDLTAAERRQLDLLDDWLRPVEPPPAPAGAITLGILGYHQPDQSRASRNVGDYVQTLAMLGHVLRFSDCTYTGADGLGELMTELRERVRDDLRVPGPKAAVHAVPVSRDFSELERHHDPTWMIAFGWHMHPVFRVRHGFPYHPAIRPIFVSFHVNRPDMLTDEALAYLRRYGPVGCRDWTTVDLLLSAGVDAFFTGCLTTTVDALFPRRDEVAPTQRLVGLVDVSARVADKVTGPSEVVRHANPEYRGANVVEGVHAAIGQLEDYQRRFTRLVTSRLHAYLPATALGVPVQFRPKKRADVRFEGLLGLRSAGKRLAAMQDGLRDLLAAPLEMVLGGASEEAVYARWREVTEPLVAEARERLMEAASLPDGPMPGLADGIATVRATARQYGPHDQVDDAAVTDVALGLDQNLLDQLPVTIEAIVSNASGPLRLWITSRGFGRDYEQWLSDAFPSLPMTFLPCDDFPHAVPRRLIGHITVATMDRLLLPELAPGVDRIVYIDIDALALGDVCELARTDLQGYPIAARSTTANAVGAWRRAGLNLPRRRAFRLRRTMAARHRYGARGLNAGVLVLDLARMRADRFTQTYLPFAEHHGLNDQDVFLAYVGGDRVKLDPRWNAWPLMEPLKDPLVVHFLGPDKPWFRGHTAGKHYWDRYAEAFQQRVSGRARPAQG